MLYRQYFEYRSHDHHAHWVLSIIYLSQLATACASVCVILDTYWNSANWQGGRNFVNAPP